MCHHPDSASAGIASDGGARRQGHGRSGQDVLNVLLKSRFREVVHQSSESQGFRRLRPNLRLPDADAPAQVPWAACYRPRRRRPAGMDGAAGSRSEFAPARRLRCPGATRVAVRADPWRRQMDRAASPTWCRGPRRDRGRARTGWRRTDPEAPDGIRHQGICRRSGLRRLDQPCPESGPLFRSCIADLAAHHIVEGIRR